MKTYKKLSDELSQFLKLLTEVQKSYNFCKEKLNLCDNATQDCLHQLELGNYSSRAKIATKLADIRKARRYYKDELDELAPLYSILQETSFSNNRNRLSDALGTIRKIENNRACRRYYPRVIEKLDFLK